MPLKKGLYTATIYTASSWKHIFMKHPLFHLVLVSLLGGQATPSTVWAQVQAAPLTGAAPSQPSQTTAYHYALPLTLALEAATEAVRTCAQRGYPVSATVVDMDGVPQVVLRGDGATIHTGESSFEKAYTVVTLGPIFNFDTSREFFNLVKTSPYAAARNDAQCYCASRRRGVQVGERHRGRSGRGRGSRRRQG